MTRDQAIKLLPIVNDESYKAVQDYIDAELAALQSEMAFVADDVYLRQLQGKAQMLVKFRELPTTVAKRLDRQ